MTFEQFQNTRTACKDIEAKLGFSIYCDDNAPVPGLVYDGDCYIELNHSNWSEASQAEGMFLLTIFNEQWLSDDLEDLERKLWQFAVDQCLFAD